MVKRILEAKCRMNSSIVGTGEQKKNTLKFSVIEDRVCVESVRKG